eukprot:15450996-Alexandrium_andersonii.AAC.1
MKGTVPARYRLPHSLRMGTHCPPTPHSGELHLPPPQSRAPRLSSLQSDPHSAMGRMGGGPTAPFPQQLAVRD